MEPNEEDLKDNIVEKELPVGMEEVPSTIPIDTTPSPEAVAFDELVAQMGELNLAVNDIVLFRNNLIGRIENISIDKGFYQYRIYVKLANDFIVTLNEQFKNMIDDAGYDVVRIISADFTNTKIEVEPEDLVLTIDEAQEELTKLKGQNVIID